MGQSGSFDQLAGKFRSFAAELESLPLEATKAATRHGKTVLLGALRVASGGDLRLSGVGRSGAKIGVWDDTKILGDGQAYGVLRATGPVQLLVHNTRPHVIVSKHASALGRSRQARQQNLLSGLNDVFREGSIRIGARSRKGKHAVIKVPGSDSGWAAYAQHPGTRGRPAIWKAAVDVVRRSAPEIYRETLVKAMKRIF